MSPEEKELLKRSVALAEENNDMLRGMKRSMRLGRFMTLVYWLFIIGSAVGAYYLIQPYINLLTDTVGGAKGSLNGLKDISGIIDNLKQQIGQ
ncbi:MAG: hypothetical protein HY507_01630 [Candidatus Zambryskibacteria bacterium]|nr:hypothetical protein [Candidatus Zambryskibacteria bacterium]